MHDKNQRDLFLVLDVLNLSFVHGTLMFFFSCKDIFVKAHALLLAWFRAV